MPKGFAPDTTSPTPEIATVEALSADQLKVNTIELENFRLKLPIGFFFNGRRLQQFSLKPLTGEIELFIRRKMKARLDLHVKFAQLFSQTVETIGDCSVPELARELSCSPEQLFQRMWFADALSILLNMRLAKQEGEKIFLSGQCPQCQRMTKDDEYTYHDLSQLEVNVPQQLSAPVVAYTLDCPFNILGQGEDNEAHMARRFHLRPLKLFEAQKLFSTGDASPGLTSLLLMYQLVCHLPGIAEYADLKGGIMNDDLYVRMGERDRRQLIHLSEKLLQWGPNLRISMECDNLMCGYKWEQAIPWGSLETFLLGLDSPA